MASNRNLLVLPGDGIGPEVMNEVRKIIAWMGKKRAVGFDIKEDVVGGAALDKHGVPLSRRRHEDGARGRRRAVRLGRRAEMGQCRVQQEARTRAAAPAQGDGPLRQPAPGQGVRRADRCELAQARDRQGPRHHDHPRADGRRLFRRAARPPHQRPGRGRGVRHPALHGGRDPPRLRRRLRAGAQAQEQGDVVGEGQRHAYRRAVARSGDQAAQGEAIRT